MKYTFLSEKLNKIREENIQFINGVEIRDEYFKLNVKKYVKNGKFTIQFPKVVFHFDCSGLGLTSLEGSPKKVVNGTFDCSDNNLKTLKGGPEEVYNYKCNNNQLESLEGISSLIQGNLECNNNNLKTLKGCPKKVDSFDCSNNYLKSLKYGPIELEGSPIGGIYNCSYNILNDLIGSPIKGYINKFDCSYCTLTSLKGCPKEINGSYKDAFNCSHNNLTDLIYAPEIIEYGGMDCSYNNLSSLIGIPKELGGCLITTNNKKTFTKNDLPDYLSEYYLNSIKIID